VERTNKSSVLREGTELDRLERWSRQTENWLLAVSQCGQVCSTVAEGSEVSYEVLLATSSLEAVCNVTIYWKHGNKRNYEIFSNTYLQSTTSSNLSFWKSWRRVLLEKLTVAH
jgi:hypothetical protein